jgi:hypothetical protein
VQDSNTTTTQGTNTIFTRCWHAVDACANTSGTVCQTITRPACESHCTLTQGAYGSKGGKYTYNGTKYTTTGLLNLLTSPANGGSIVVGVVGTNSLTIPNSAVTCLDGDNGCGLARLPANTTPSALPSGFGDQTLGACMLSGKKVLAGSCQTTPPIPLQSSGQWQSVLLGQTVTLTLNTRLDPTLLGFVLCNGNFRIPASVLTALNDPTCNGGYNHTVQGLLYLANRALAGQSTCGASLSNINDAVDAINEGFDSDGNAHCPSVTPCP